MSPIESLIQLRHKLHQYPELSGEEENTAGIIKDFIRQFHPTKMLENLGGSGLAAIYDFGTNGPTVTIRCELDALPIKEENEMVYTSVYDGVAHKCGHDGHMTIVAGLIFWLKNQQSLKGQVVLLFQPAEETGKGAYKVIQDPRFVALETDYMFALHNIPGEPMHHIITMDLGFSAEVQSFALSFEGKTSHAAEPENGVNPSIAIATIIENLSKLNLSDPMDPSYAILTPVYVHIGDKSYGISPGNGELHYTIRTWDEVSMQSLKERIIEIAGASCKQHGIAYQINWFEHFPACANNGACNLIVSNAAKMNDLNLIERPYPFKFGEDFGWFSKNYKAAMFGLGAGQNTPALHNADYDFPDELISTGIDMFTSIIKNLLQSDG